MKELIQKNLTVIVITAFLVIVLTLNGREITDAQVLILYVAVAGWFESLWTNCK